MDFEKHIEELKTLIPFKDTIDIDDIVVFVLPDIFMYGIVKKIERDFSKKIEWWHITFVMFTIPLRSMSLTLRTEQMTGKETFTIDGKFRFFSAVNTNVIEEKEIEDNIKELPKPTKRKFTLVKKKVEWNGN